MIILFRCNYKYMIDYQKYFPLLISSLPERLQKLL